MLGHRGRITSRSSDAQRQRPYVLFPSTNSLTSRVFRSLQNRVSLSPSWPTDTSQRIGTCTRMRIRPNQEQEGLDKVTWTACQKNVLRE